MRSASADEVRSIGAKFIDLGLEALEGTGGYARAMTEDRATKQRELLTPYVAASDAVICTAAVPGRAAPLLVTREMVEAMRPGSIVVDLAAESGGNCELSVAGEAVDHNGVTVWGAKDLASTMPLHASQLFARNVSNLLLLMTKDGRVEPDWEYEIVSSACVTRDAS
jgi:NAD(P) transhydrogenase subunit alpha